MNPSLHAQLEQLGRTLASRNNQPIELFQLDKPEGKTPTEPPERSAKPLSSPNRASYQGLVPLRPSEVISARQVAVETLSHGAIRTALYCTEARNKLIAEAQVLAKALRACVPPPPTRSDRRAAIEHLHTELVALALAVKQARGYKAADQIAVHQSTELLADTLQISTASFYRYLPYLREVGLVDYRGNKSSAPLPG